MKQLTNKEIQSVNGGSNHIAVICTVIGAIELSRISFKVCGTLATMTGSVVTDLAVEGYSAFIAGVSLLSEV